MYPSCRSRTDLYAEHNNVVIQTPGMAPIPDIMQPSCCNSVLFTDLTFLEVWKCKHTDQPITGVVGDDTTHPSPRKKWKKKKKKLAYVGKNCATITLKQVQKQQLRMGFSSSMRM